MKIGTDKLRIEKFENIMFCNFDEHYVLDRAVTKHDPEVIIYHVRDREDVKDALTMAIKENLPLDDNRLILVYEKARKDGLNKNYIYDLLHNDVFGLKSPERFHLKKPLICKINEVYSAIPLMRVE